MSLKDANGTRKCPICGVGQLRKRTICEQYELEDRGRIVLVQTTNVPLEDCDYCGKSFSGPEAARIRHEALGHALGLLTPREIIAVRQSLAMNQADFANSIGVREEEVSDWERGRLWQNRVADNLLRFVSKNPESLNVPQNYNPDLPNNPVEEPAPSDVETASQEKHHSTRGTRVRTVEFVPDPEPKSESPD